MNTFMYTHPLTAQHLAVLEDTLKYTVVGPIGKGLACGDVGTGAMTEWRDIVRLVVDHFALTRKPGTTPIPNPIRVPAPLTFAQQQQLGAALQGLDDPGQLELLSIVQKHAASVLSPSLDSPAGMFDLRIRSSPPTPARERQCGDLALEFDLLQLPPSTQRELFNKYVPVFDQLRLARDAKR